ncbi:MAG: hypothetical protein MUC35_02300 [Candidatus Margulisbacteria bacterium]|jgi:hypothetical protein|nr:hypothetical protein [Candidatus Margulisiibacteriota bacterium]
MEINPVSDPSWNNCVEGPLSYKGPRLCLYYQEEMCAAPRVKFAACRACCRINPHQAASNLFERIKQLAADLFNLKEPGQPPRE